MEIHVWQDILEDWGIIGKIRNLLTESWNQNVSGDAHAEMQLLFVGCQ